MDSSEQLLHPASRTGQVILEQLRLPGRIMRDGTENKYNDGLCVDIFNKRTLCALRQAIITQT
jgi:hypothetical protein